jgi:hypothetical protein
MAAMSPGKRKPQKFYFPRETLLVEIERRCRYPDCEARNLIGLTKSEAIEYRGFECSKCQRWNDDTVNPDTLPESWASDLWLNRDDLSAQ